MDEARPTAVPRDPAGSLRRGARRALTVGAIVPAVALAIAAPAFAAVTAVDGAASGVSASTTGTLAISVPPTPSVALPSGGSATPITGTVASVNAAPLLSTGVVNTSTQGTPAGGSVTSSASVDDTALVGLAGANLLTADVISSQCVSNESGSTGSSTITGLTALGVPVNVTGAPNQTVNIAGLGTLHINEQITTGSGSSTSIVVNALRLQLNVPLATTGTVTLSHSECGVTSDDTTVPTGAVGGVLLSGLAAIGFAGFQFSRRRRGQGVTES